MSGPDERRGTDGGEHPLDVDARFADIVAHFHDGEPALPRVVDDPGGPPAPTTVDGTTGPGRADAPTDPEPGAGPVLFFGPTVAGDGVDDRPASGDHDRVDDPAATDWAARYERAAREELAAHEERVARAEREARIEAEVDRAVDGPGSHFVPAEPPPIPRPDLPGRMAWGAVLLGPLVLVLCALLWRSVPPWVVGTVVTAIVAGFGYLVWRLPSTRDRDDPGDGAIV